MKIDISPLLSREALMADVKLDGTVNRCVQVVDAFGEWFVRVATTK